MFTRRSLCLAGATAALICLAAEAASAQQPPDKRTLFTFSGPVRMPGIVLPAGE